MRYLKKITSVLLISSIFINNTQNLLVFASEQLCQSEVNGYLRDENIKLPELTNILVDKKVAKPGDKVTVTMDIDGLDKLN